MNSKQVEHLEITLALTPGSFDDDAMTMTQSSPSELFGKT